MPLTKFLLSTLEDDANLQDGFTIRGDAFSAGGSFGWSVTGIGDFDGDSFADFMIGAPASNGSAGAVYIVYGPDSTNPGNTFGTPPTPPALDPNPFDDLSNDSIFDLNELTEGVHYTRIEGVAPSTPFDPTGDQLGFSVSEVGYFNVDPPGDNFSDVIFSAPGADSRFRQNVGETYVLYGRDDRPAVIDVEDIGAGTPGLALTGGGRDDLVGSSVANLGDINGDGANDFMIGAPGSNEGGTDSGAGYVIYGPGGAPDDIDLTQLSPTVGFTVTGGSRDMVGAKVSAAGDMNNDGFDDFLIASPDGANGAGEIYLIWGREFQDGSFSGNPNRPFEINLDRLTTDNLGVKFTGVNAAGGDEAGASIGSGGDVNGDGVDDLIIGAPRANDGVGGVYIIYGQDMSTTAGFTAETNSAYGDMAATLPATIAEGVVGGATWDESALYGASPIYGGARNWTRTVDLGDITHEQGTFIAGDADDRQFGRDVYMVGDLDRDGIEDLVIGSPGSSDELGAPVSGSIYVLRGRTDWDFAFEDEPFTPIGAFDTMDGWELVGTDPFDTAGWSVSVVGDFDTDDGIVVHDLNDDDTLDIIIGAPSANGGDGEVYVFFTPLTYEPQTWTPGDDDPGMPDQRIGTPNSDYIDALGGADTVLGLGLRDSIDGRGGNDIIFGGSHADTLNGGDGNDTIYGDPNEALESVIPGAPAAGDPAYVFNDERDTLDGGAGNDRLFGGVDEDRIFGGADDDLIEGGDGDDSITGGAGADSLFGDDGDDILFDVEADDVTLQGGAGTDTAFVAATSTGGVTLTFENSIETAFGNDGLDSIDVFDFSGFGPGAPDVRFEGGGGDDQLIGGTGDDLLRGETGDDVIRGGDGDDVIDGGDGDDDLRGNNGNDTISGDDGDDRLRGDNGDDELFGGAGVDRVDGGNGDDQLFGGDGDDDLRGNNGNDTINGDDGDDRLRGDNGDDQLFGGVGVDRLDGGNGDDQLFGGADNDDLRGNAGNDFIRGGAGEDVLRGGGGADDLDGGDDNDRLFVDNLDNIQGGAGIDRVDVVGTSAGVTLSSANGVETAFGADGTNVIDVFDFSGFAPGAVSVRGDGGGGNDTITGADNNDRLRGENGDDELFGGAGNDRLDGGADNDELFGGLGNDDLRGDDGNDILNGDDGDDRLRGGTGGDQLFGGIGVDRLEGGAGADDLFGGDGDDRLIVDDLDNIQGGAGLDRVDVLATSAGVTLSSANGVETAFGADGTNVIDVFDFSGFAPGAVSVRGDGGGGNDTITGADNNDRLRGENGDDELFGGAGNDRLDGGNDNDELFGGLGNDDLRGDDGNDILNGDDGDDRLRGGTGDDQLFGGIGVDRLEGGAGADDLFGGDGDDRLIVDDLDNIQGGAGLDRVDVLATSAGVTLSSANGVETAFGADGTNVIDVFDFSGFAPGAVSVRGDGGGGNDTITGADNNDRLRGENGDDELFGGAGNDRLDGGADNDELSGGLGNDDLRGDGGNDILNGDDGDDRLRGGTGDDQLFGGIGVDRLDGNDGGDFLFGGAGVDDLRGGNGDDTIAAGADDGDIMRGQGDADVFVLSAGDGVDTIWDFTDGVDRIDFRSHANVNSIADYTAVDLGASVRLDFLGADSIFLRNFNDPADLDASDFIFI